MAELVELAYVSSATRNISEEQLKTILSESRVQNARAGLSGVLLFHDGTFFQYLEGAPDAIDETFRRIARSSLHGGIIELVRGPIEHRQFGEWSMGFTHSPKEKMLELAKADWKSIVPTALGSSTLSEGLVLLRNFWELNRNKWA